MAISDAIAYKAIKSLLFGKIPKQQASSKKKSSSPSPVSLARGWLLKERNNSV
ncbi:hypothetical protein [Paenibacillus sp. XY044]|uniref:hypothetical protein n=1 Tax=Paenibacillus sp. XY044 TaxID=2026089 RepID=UPI0015C586DD|nr:hypothetical protein [Paenibacillus sp. XY044]